MADTGDLDQAITMAQRAKQQRPNNADISDTLGWIYIKKNLRQRIVIFRDLVRDEPERPRTAITTRWRFQKGDEYPPRRSARRHCDQSVERTRKSRFAT